MAKTLVFSAARRNPNLMVFAAPTRDFAFAEWNGELVRFTCSNARLSDWFRLRILIAYVQGQEVKLENWEWIMSQITDSGLLSLRYPLDRKYNDSVYV